MPMTLHTATCYISFSDNNINSNLHYVNMTKHPALVVMLRVVVLIGDKMPPMWFLAGYRLTAVDYLEILKITIKSYILKVTKQSGKGTYVFQQDGVPSQTANSV